MAISVETTTCNIINLTARMPFRYGIASLTTIPHLFIHVHCDIDGKLQEGIAADSLIPKWFTKDPESAYEDDIQDMIQVIEAACRFAEEAKAVPTVFDLWQSVYLRQREWAMRAAYPPLLWGFGLSLLEHAVLDAYCRAKNATLAVALRGNTLGIRLDEIHPELADYEPVDLLPSKPLEKSRCATRLVYRTR